jgi:hypothetical protein
MKNGLLFAVLFTAQAGDNWGISFYGVCLLLEHIHAGPCGCASLGHKFKINVDFAISVHHIVTEI